MNKKSGTDSKSAPNHKIPLIKFYLCLCAGFILSLNHESRGMNLENNNQSLQIQFFSHHIIIGKCRSSSLIARMWFKFIYLPMSESKHHCSRSHAIHKKISI